MIIIPEECYTIGAIISSLRFGNKNIAVGSKIDPTGFRKLSANFVTVKPAGATGVLPFGHPITLLLFFTAGVANGGGNVSSRSILDSGAFFVFDFSWALHAELIVANSSTINEYILIFIS